MAKESKAKRTRSAPSPAAAVTDKARHRFPWPANPVQRYSGDSPWLAVVNARGPWGVWQHRRIAPPWLPWCRSLWAKAFWEQADDGLRVFCWRIWQAAADESVWGIIWGDPVRLCRLWRFEPAVFNARLEAMLAAGFLAYLTDAERDAAMTWRPGKAGSNGAQHPAHGDSGEGDSYVGGGRGGSNSGVGAQITGTETGDRDRERDSDSDSAQQVPGLLSARKSLQVPGSEPTATETGTGTGIDTGTAIATDTAQHSEQAQAQATEPASLPKSDRVQEGAIPCPQQGRQAGHPPKSDHGAGHGPPRTTEGVRGPQHKARPPSVSRPSRRRGERLDASRIGDVLGWCNPMAVDFGRGMYEAITGHAPPADLTAAPESVRGDVGVWVHYWVTEVERLCPAGRLREFAERCYRDVAKKRKVRGIRNLGRVARARIVPGILAAMVREGAGVT